MSGHRFFVLCKEYHLYITIYITMKQIYLDISRMVLILPLLMRAETIELRPDVGRLLMMKSDNVSDKCHVQRGRIRYNSLSELLFLHA